MYTSPSSAPLLTALEMLEYAWQENIKQFSQGKAYLQEQLDELNTQMAHLIERIMAARSSTLIRSYENRLEELENQKIVLYEEYNDSSTEQPNAKEIYRIAAIARPFRLLSDIAGSRWKMVEPSGIEPLTSTLPVLRSPS